MRQTKRRPFSLVLAATALAFLSPTFCASPHLSPASSRSWAAETADLKDRLEKGLKARRPVEFNFIARVVELVEQDTLPLSLVDGTFHWARRQREHPFQYFERGLRLRAKKIGVTL